MKNWFNILSQQLSLVFEDIITNLFNILIVIILLIIAYIFLKIFRKLLLSAVHLTKFDKVAKKTGVTDFLRKLGIEREPSHFIVNIIFWLLFLLLLIIVIKPLGLSGAETILNKILLYIPLIIEALLLIIAGIFAANFLESIAQSTAENAGLSSSEIIGQIVRYIIILLSIMMALQQLGISVLILTSTFSIILGGVTLACAISFGIGSKEIAENVVAGRHLKNILIPGEIVTIRQYTGSVIKVGLVSTSLQTENGIINIPNSIITKDVIVHHFKQENN